VLYPAGGGAMLRTHITHIKVVNKNIQAKITPTPPKQKKKEMPVEKKKFYFILILFLIFNIYFFFFFARAVLRK
jgi:NADH:ubiquinone oxidoreductase subunit 3 (subunit A)